MQPTVHYIMSDIFRQKLYNCSQAVLAYGSHIMSPNPEAPGWGYIDFGAESVDVGVGVGVGVRFHFRALSSEPID